MRPKLEQDLKQRAEGAQLKPSAPELDRQQCHPVNSREEAFTVRLKLGQGPKQQAEGAQLKPSMPWLNRIAFK